jgi:hypothetical protein
MINDQYLIKNIGFAPKLQILNPIFYLFISYFTSHTADRVSSLIFHLVSCVLYLVSCVLYLFILSQ